MASDRNASDDDWLFATDDGFVPTEKLPSPEDYARMRAQQAQLEDDAAAQPRLTRPERPAPVRVPDMPDTSTQEIPILAPAPNTAAPAQPASPAEEEAATRPGGSTAVRVRRVDDDLDGESTAEHAVVKEPIQKSYARSGTTPTVAPEELKASISLPVQFRTVSPWDVVRDVLAVVSFIAVFATTVTESEHVVLDSAARIAAGIGIVGVAAASLMRWKAKDTNFQVIQNVRMLCQIPAVVAVLGVIGADFGASLPDLFHPLPDGPTIGVGAGVALLALGATVGGEPPRHEGHTPGEKQKGWARMALRVMRVLAYASFALAVVMMIGKAFAGAHLFALVTLSHAVPSLALIVLFLEAVLHRRPSWYVFEVGAVGLLVAGAIMDSSLEMEYAAPQSFSTGYVWLPLLFVGFGIVINRAYVRSMPLSFRRSDWIIYTVRAFEFSLIMHVVGFVSALAFVVAVFLGYDDGTPLSIAAMNAAFMVVFAVASAVARHELMCRHAARARTSGVVISVALAVLGFLGVIVNSVVASAGGTLTNGGLALIIGIAAGLMLTVPAPVRDEHGAPSLDRWFSEFRHRDLTGTGLWARVPDVGDETRQRRTFPTLSR